MLYRSPAAIVTHFLREVDLFQGLSTRHIERVGALCEDLDFKAGDYLGYQDEPGDRLYVVRSGEVTATTGAREKSLVVRTVRPHEAFPVAIFFNPPILVTTSRAATDGSAFVIPRVRLMELCQLEPRIGLHIFSAACGILASRYRYTLDRLAEVVPGVDISPAGDGGEI
jgi:CRP-like cAMP-binding protein